MEQKIKGKEIKDFIINNIIVKEAIIRPWKLTFKPLNREVVIVNRGFVSTKWTHPEYTKGFIVECLMCEEDIKKPPIEESLLSFIIDHSEEHIKNGVKKNSKKKPLDNFL